MRVDVFVILSIVIICFDYMPMQCAFNIQIPLLDWSC